MRNRNPASPGRGTALALCLVAAGAVLLALLRPSAGGPEHGPEQRPLIEGSERSDPNPLLSARELRAARRSAHAFLDSYLRVAFAEAPPTALHPLSVRLRRQPHLVVPRPMAMSKASAILGLEIVVQAPGLVLATATLRADGGAYPFSFNLEPESGRWVVTTVGAD